MLSERTFGQSYENDIFIYCFSGSNLLCDVLFRKLEEAKALYIAIYVNPYFSLYSRVGHTKCHNSEVKQKAEGN